MEKVTIAHRLAEEIRTNKKLRAAIGMSENSQVLIAEDSSTVWLEGQDGKAHVVEVRNA